MPHIPGPRKVANHLALADKESLARCIKGYRIGKLLGSGAYGQVYELCENGSCDRFAMKIGESLHPEYATNTTIWKLDPDLTIEPLAHCQLDRSALAASLRRQFGEDVIIYPQIRGSVASERSVSGADVLRMFDLLERVRRLGYNHLDCTLGNFFRAKDGRIVLGDWGKAKRATDPWDIKLLSRDLTERKIPLPEKYAAVVGTEKFPGGTRRPEFRPTAWFHGKTFPLA